MARSLVTDNRYYVLTPISAFQPQHFPITALPASRASYSIVVFCQNSHLFFAILKPECQRRLSVPCGSGNLAA